MQDKFRIYITSVLIGIFLCSVGLGSAYALYKQRGRLKGIAKKYAKLARAKTKAKSVGQKKVLEEKDTVRGAIKIYVDPRKEIATVSNLLYGSNLAPQAESEPDIIQFAKNIGISCFRFPGNGSSGYHWQTGKSDFISRCDNAPLSRIDYLVKFCQATNTKLIIQVNVESGTADEAAGWVKYMNQELNFPVEYWQLGDEVYGDWDKGYMSADKYAQVIKEYATAMKKVDPQIKIGMDWAPQIDEKFNIAVIKKAGRYIDFVAVHWYPNHVDTSHRYRGRIHPTPNEVMANYLQIPLIVKRVQDIVAKHASRKKGKIEVTFMGWDGAWDGPNSDMYPYSQGILQWSLANAIFHADSLGQFAQNGVSVSAQYLFQDINFGLIRGWDKDSGWGGQRWDGETIRPKALAIKLFSKHFGDVVIDSKVENFPYYYKESDWWADSYTGKVPYVSCYASKSTQKNTISLVLINKHAEKEYKVNVAMKSVEPKQGAQIFVLSGPSLYAQNEGKPGNVRIREYQLPKIDRNFSYNLPAHSVNVFEISL
ncbi:alpha-L-arabinofuranosidase C-terminal domain-containing protein [Candidatus Omnitrophota bacterium]